jgi:hypothetical protein
MSRNKPVIAVAAGLLAVPLIAAAGPAHAVPPSPSTEDRAAKSSIQRTPDAVVVSEDQGHISLSVTYTCTNTGRTTFYLSGAVTQPDGPPYVIGARFDVGGPVTAVCTGKPVTQKLTYLRSRLADDAVDLQSGPGELRFSLDQRTVMFYGTTGPGARVERTVHVTNPRTGAQEPI